MREQAARDSRGGGVDVNCGRERACSLSLSPQGGASPSFPITAPSLGGAGPPDEVWDEEQDL